MKSYVSNPSSTIEALVGERNRQKLLFTAGPASLLSENLTGLRPCFGRGDADYQSIEETVLEILREMSGHRFIARMQGSASLALEIAALNFLSGRVLIVSTGFYSKRLEALAESAARREGRIASVVSVDWKELESVSGRYDWVWACSVETSAGLRLPIDRLAQASRKLGARLMLDATASIGLESGHELCDVMAYSSCKGLFGLTGACFIAYNESPGNEVDSFYMKLSTHTEKSMTGPYHAIASLHDVLSRHGDFRFAVEFNKRLFVKRMETWRVNRDEHEPLICTRVACEIASRDERAVLYKPRGQFNGSVVCHLGEVHLGRSAKGEILDGLEVRA